MPESLKIFSTYCIPEWIPLIEHHCQRFEFNKKDVIFNIGDKVEGIYFIQKGFVKVESELNGEYCIIRLAGDGMILGHRGLHRNLYSIRATCLSHTTLSFLPIQLFKSVLMANSNLAMYMIHFLSDELYEAEERNRNLQISDPRRKISLVLLKLAHTFGYTKTEPQKLAFRITRQDLANMTGTTYETVIRTLSLLEKQKFIKLDNKDILIINEKKLLELSASPAMVKQRSKK